MADHVHILAGLKPTSTVAGTLRDLKRASSAWIHTEMKRPAFDWQEGYGAFTASRRDLVGSESYIAGQAEHHKHVSFRDERIALCEEAGVEIDMRYFD